MNGCSAHDVSAVWSAPAVAVWIFLLTSGQVGPLRIGGALLSNTVRNGLPEEVLWRGLIQTRIARLGGARSTAGGRPHRGVQASFGLAYGVIFDRTRNLVAPSVVRVLTNSVIL